MAAHHTKREPKPPALQDYLIELHLTVDINDCADPEKWVWEELLGLARGVESVQLMSSIATDGRPPVKCQGCGSKFYSNYCPDCGTELERVAPLPTPSGPDDASADGPA